MTILTRLLERVGLRSAPEPEPHPLYQARLREAIAILEQFPEQGLAHMTPLGVLMSHWQAWEYEVSLIIAGEFDWVLDHIERIFEEGSDDEGWTPGIGRDRVVAHLKTLLTSGED